jgi:hypothetical protein
MTAGGRLMAVAVAPIGSEFVFEAAQGLFQTPVIPETWNHYDVARDGQQFLLNAPRMAGFCPVYCRYQLDRAIGIFPGW